MVTVRMAMIGGGRGAFIGPVHRRAVALDGEIQLVAGAFSSDPQISVETGRALGLPGNRIYPSYQALFEGESALPSHERAEFVSIVTPNDSHVAIARSALALGFGVFCEKPVALTLAEAQSLRSAVLQANRPFAVSYTYLGYPLVQEAAARVSDGQIGAVRRVIVTYTQGWLAQAAEQQNNRQAKWRTDPVTAGAAGAFADIGVHAQSLAEFVTGLPIMSVSADIRSAVANRKLDDDGAALLRFANGARGMLVSSQVCIGDANRLELRVMGELGSLEWAQEQPNVLRMSTLERPSEYLTVSPASLRSPQARALLRLPEGHPEGFIEALANLYRAFARQLRGEGPQLFLPGLREGLRSMAFIEACVASSAADGRWVEINDGRGNSDAND